MSNLLTVDHFDSFRFIKDTSYDSINPVVINTVKELNEKTQLEPFIRASIFDLNDTPHGPMEIVDILTTKLSIKSQKKYSAFIIKGKSFKRITAQDISHQIYRLKKISGLDVAILAYTGNLLDQPQEEFIAICKEIGCDYAIWNDYDIARILISEGFICPRDGRVIEGNICSCGYNPKRDVLNVFQEEAIKELKLAHKIGQTRGLVVLPTGSGKTRVAAMDVKNHGFNKVLYLAHTNEILESAVHEFEKHFGKDDINLIKEAKGISSLSRINFITIQLLSNNYERLQAKKFDYIVVDEFHHAAAPSYVKCIQFFEPQFQLGLTATPFRADRNDILELCNGNLIVNYELRDGIDFGILSPYHYFGYFDNVDYSRIRHNGISYDIRDLEKALIINDRDFSIIEKWQERALNKPTIGFCCSHLHAKRCCENFSSKGINSAVYLASTSQEARRQILDDFKNGKVKVIFTVDVLNEGVDFPFVECLLFMRPTESKRVFLQQLGRGLRRYHGKSRTIVLDFIGNFTNAFKIVEYFGLTTTVTEENYNKLLRPKTYKEIFNLPSNCEISFDESVINIIGDQIFSKENRNINRHNIHRILIQQFLSLCTKINKIPTWKEIDRNCSIDSSIYKMFYKRPKEIAVQIEDILTEKGIEIK